MFSMTVGLRCVFFFFFKQKTAYEMRISDWSSDVCSSDLRQRLVAILGLVGLQRVADPGAGVVVVDIEQFELVETRGVDLFEIFGRHFVASFDVDLAGRFVDEVIGAVTAEDFRSEEHTSELPSLMRTSYAVFCLTKKLLITPIR